MQVRDRCLNSLRESQFTTYFPFAGIVLYPFMISFLHFGWILLSLLYYILPIYYYLHMLLFIFLLSHCGQYFVFALVSC